jgi:serine phosphatase RsbU (regulator of sigma subunit)
MSIRPDASLAAVELAADLVHVSTPQAIRRRLLRGLVHDVGMDAAAVWSPADHGDHHLELRDHVGLSADVASPGTQWHAGSLPDHVIGVRPVPNNRSAFEHTAVAWNGRTLYVVAVPEPADEILGVFAAGGVSDFVMRMVVALAKTYVTAVAQADAMRDNQRVVDAVVNELRPTDVALPGGYSIGHLYRSATAGVAIGGDLYDWFRTDRGAFGVAVGDVSGKGVQAASRTAMTVHSLRAFALPGASPHVVATMLNTVVSGRSSNESFVTLIYVHVDPESSELGFVVAGHPPPILLSADGAEVLDVQADLPIGVDASASFHLQHATLRVGDSLVLYTDGVTEARTTGGGLLGTRRLINLLGDLRGSSAQRIANGVWQGVQEHTDGDTTDDVAVVVLQRGS